MINRAELWRYTKELGLILRAGLLFLLFAPCVPFIICWACFSPPRRKCGTRPQHAYIEPATRALPALRQRALSEVAVNPQLEALIITRLPAEVRILLWNHILGRRSQRDVLHLDLADGNLLHVPCLMDQPDWILGFKHGCWTDYPWLRAESFHPKYTITRPKQALLLTCRLM